MSTASLPIAIEIDHGHPSPLHVKVEHLIRSMLQLREYSAGDRSLPPEVELANRLGVSRATVRQAMQRLVHEGLLIRKRNAGTRVAPRHLKTSLTDWGSFSAEMVRQGVALQSLRVRAQMAIPPAEVACFFQLERTPGSLSLVRLKGEGGEPVVEFRSWLHPRLNLSTQEDFSLPLYELIDRVAHVVVTRSVEEIGATAADAALAAELQCGLGQPILTRRRWVSDAENRPVEFCDCFYRADRFSYGIEVRRNGVATTAPGLETGPVTPTAASSRS